ncbi:MAG: carbohydrate ABC transporter permease [Eubacteriales bacterium]
MVYKIKKLVPKVILVVLGLSFIYPLYWMTIMSFKNASEVYVNPFGLPEIWDLTNYAEALASHPFFKYMLNSATYTVVTAFVTVLIGSMLAYAVSRMNWRFGNMVLTYITTGLIIPAQVIMIPLYKMVSAMGIRDMKLALILPYIAFELASCVLMVNAFFRGLPNELEEAACLDGCNIYQCFFKVIFPVVKPALVTQIVLISIHTWNEFSLALVIGAKENMRPLTVGLLDFFVSIGVADWGVIGAAMIMTSVPIMIVYCIGNNQIENALTAGAVLK